jgi:adenylyltransferase/sulfurtransferase
MFAAIPSISVEELKQSRDRGDALVLVDVREPRETVISDLPGSVKIPLGTLTRSLDRLDKADDIVVFCRSGARSGQAVQYLRQMGFTKVRNLAGGINRWAEVVDPKMPRY